MCDNKLLRVPKIIKILENPDDICQSDINTEHIIKASHASKWNINIVDEKIKLEAIKKNFLNGIPCTIRP